MNALTYQDQNTPFSHENAFRIAVLKRIVILLRNKRYISVNQNLVPIFERIVGKIASELELKIASAQVQS